MVARAGLGLARLVLGADWDPDRLLGYAVGGRLSTTEHGKEQPVISHRLKVGGKTPGGTCLITGRETLPEVIVPACAVGHTMNARLCPPNEGTVDDYVVVHSAEIAHSYYGRRAHPADLAVHSTGEAFQRGDRARIGTTAPTPFPSIIQVRLAAGPGATLHGRHRDAEPPQRRRSGEELLEKINDRPTSGGPPAD